MGLVESLVKKMSRKAVVVGKRQIADHTYRISMELQGADKMPYTPGEFLRVFVGEGQPVKLSEMIRTYSVWNYDTQSGIVDIAACTFSSGAGARWAKQVKVGDPVHFAGPKGKFVSDDSGDYYILIGDISALAHLYELNRHIPASKKVFSLVYAENEQSFFADLDGETKLTFRALPPNPVQALIEQIEDITKQAQGRGMVYVGGDGRVCVELHDYFKKKLQWDRGQIKVKPFWMPGKTGLE
ncbi:siderophore-interacting protein [Paenibacillus sp. CF384]|uniref:siderophore-interacting protein n=1 Tax=Paenibacillus sp. CF384 TaxID=1884382 RepID=UPI00089529EF|nr:siderophore-interacting protein [Paenibacillus sp. CF384]SDX75744.1 NADPH-dependent ferric siderophore reductase, contains FAD-binding and SIP domains [Paenibacillus sp. CF384]